MRSMTKNLAFLVAIVLIAPACAAEAQPSTEQFKQVFEAQLQKLTPTGVTERTVLFQEVRPGKATAGVHSFQVTALIHDYGPGYPANRYYGQTCVGKMDKWPFDLRKDDFGDWLVQGRMTVTNSECKDNPSHGVSAMPVSGLPGQPAKKSVAAAPAGQPKQAAASPAGRPVPLGEYACYGVGSRLMAGMGFLLKPGGKYTDVDGERGGTYAYDAAGATVTFKSGFLDGQAGRNVNASGFSLSATVSCEPWK